MIATCAKTGCNLPVYVDPRKSIAHKYCGRTHAVEVVGNVKAPHGICHVCNLGGCHETVAFDPVTGRVHDFCCRDHADRAIRSGSWVKPVRDLSLTNKKKSSSDQKRCSFPFCSLPVYQDASGRQHDYCGRSHAVDHRQMQERVGHVSSSSATAGGAAASNYKDRTNVAGTVQLSPFKTYVLRFDGGSQGNPGICGAGMVLYEEHNYTSEKWAGSLFLARNGTNNEAEYQALIYGLKCAHLFGVKHIVAQGDSELVVKQVLGIYQCESLNLMPLLREAMSIKQNFQTFEIRHISRAQNFRADMLANEAMTTMVSRRMEALLDGDKKPSAVAGAQPPMGRSAVPQAPAQAQCAICLELNADIIIIPCGHVCLCKEDADRLAASRQLVECPLCKQHVTGTYKVFFNH